MKFLDAEYMDIAKKLHFKKGRKPWKYNPITKKQKAFLIKNKVETEGIDRGTASIIIMQLINREEESRINSFLYGGFPNNPGYDDDF